MLYTNLEWGGGHATAKKASPVFHGFNRMAPGQVRPDFLRCQGDSICVSCPL